MNLDLLITIVVIVVCLLFVVRRFVRGRGDCAGCGDGCDCQVNKVTSADGCPGKRRE